MARLPYEEAFADMAATMMKRKGIDRAVISVIRKLEEKEKARGEDDTESEFMNICRIFSQIQVSSNHYVLYLKLRYLDHIDGRESMEEIYQRLFGKVVNLWDLDDSVFRIAVKNQIPLEDIFTGIKFENWKKGVDILFERGSREKIELRKGVIDKLCRKKNIRFSYFRLKWSEWECREVEEELSYQELYQRIENFCNSHLEFYGSFYKENVFTGEMEMLPPACRLAVRLDQVLKEERAGNIPQMREALKACFKVYPPVDPTLQRFADLFGRYKKQELQEMDRAREEMALLAVQIQEKVEELLKQRLYGEAWQIWQQLVILLPEDEEVFHLGERIKGGLS